MQFIFWFFVIFAFCTAAQGWSTLSSNSCHH